MPNTFYLRGAVALVTCALVHHSSVVRGDIVVSTFPFVVNGGVQRFDQVTGTELTLGDVPALAVPELGPTSSTDVAVGPDGNIYVTNEGNILYFDGTTGAPLPAPLGPSFPDGLFTAITAESDNNGDGKIDGFTSLAFQGDRLYAVDISNPEQDVVRVFEGPTSTNPGMEILIGGSPLLASPSVPAAALTSLTFDNSGNLLVSDLSGRKVYQVDVETGADSVIIDAVQSPQVFSISGIAVDSSDNIYVVDLFGGAVYTYDSNGQNEQLFATIPVLPGDTDGGSFPSDIVFDRNGDLLVAVLGGERVSPTQGRVLRIDPTGTIVETITGMQLPLSGIALIDDLVPADYDGNGTVESADFGEWKSQFGDSIAAFTGADGNGDGTVDLADYTLWRDSLGATGIEATAGQFAPVPEPGTLVGSLGLLACLAGRARRQPSRVANAPEGG